jgi:plasmid stability protein
MSVNLSVKNAPDAMVERLKARAKRNHRSLQGEMMAILERAADEYSPIPPDPQTPEEIEAMMADRRKAIDELREFSRTLPYSPIDSVTLIRQMRDEDDEWSPE